MRLIISIKSYVDVCYFPNGMASDGRPSPCMAVRVNAVTSPLPVRYHVRASRKEWDRYRIDMALPDSHNIALSTAKDDCLYPNTAISGPNVPPTALRPTLTTQTAIPELPPVGSFTRNDTSPLITSNDTRIIILVR